MSFVHTAPCHTARTGSYGTKLTALLPIPAWMRPTWIVSPVGVFSSSAFGVTVRVRRRPSRSISMGNGCFGRARIVRTRSSAVKARWPAIEITTSPGRRPAASAGEPGATELICGTLCGPVPMSQTCFDSRRIGSWMVVCCVFTVSVRVVSPRVTVSSRGRPFDAATARSTSSQ